MQFSPRPRVLITRAEDVPSERWDDYADRVRAAGGDPVVAALGTPLEALTAEPVGGLILTGGVDIDPAIYGEQRSERVTEVNRARDEFELALLRWGLAGDTPVLGVCRGHQLLNVAMGGTLVQHLEEREPHRSRRGADGIIDSGWHDVDIVPGTLLATVLGLNAMRTNSRHHQAVTLERRAPDLRTAATTADGVVEALVHPSMRWVVSVQWHPERAEMGDSCVPLFDAFVAACRETAR